MTIAIGRCRIKELLRIRGWKATDLAHATGLDDKTISFYATNRRKKMPLVTAVIIGDALGVNPRDLFEWIPKSEQRKG